MSLEQLIDQFGYPVVFFGAFLEGETAVVLGGFAAHRGYLAPVVVCAIAAAAAFLSDQLYFFVGRRYGPRVLAKKPDWERRSARIRDYIKRKGTWFIFGFRFMYGIRTISPFVIGMSEVSTWRFVAINAISAVVWGAGFGLLGFLAGAAAEQILGDVKQYEGYIFAGILLVGIVTWVVIHLRIRRASTS